METRKLSPEFSGMLRTFGFWLANGTVGISLLEGIDYWDAMRESPSILEGAMAVFANVLELDAAGIPVNAKYAEHRAAQYIRSWCDPGYRPQPPFAGEETKLQKPPPLHDPKPWPSSLK